jgi:hypothetical protein
MIWKYGREATQLLLPLKPVALHAALFKPFAKNNCVWGGNIISCDDCINFDVARFRNSKSAGNRGNSGV